MTFGIDILHCMHLGVFLAWLTRLFQLLIAMDGFQTRTTRKAELWVLSALEIKSRLHAWYPSYERSLSAAAKKGMTRINHLTDKMLGNAEGTKLVKLKAAEARHCLPFGVYLCKQFEAELREVVDFDSLLLAGECLVEWMAIINREPRKMSRDAVLQLTEAIRKHNVCAARAGVHLLPKHHQALLFC